VNDDFTIWALRHNVGKRTAAINPKLPTRLIRIGER
jgi:hypothetical protein